MKKISTILIAVVVAVCAVVATGCEKINPETLTQLATPTVTTLKDGNIYWSSVNGATRYVISVNDLEDYSEEGKINYPVHNLIKESCDITVKVKAKGNNILYKDSEWSEPKTFTYTVPESGDSEIPDNWKTVFKDIGIGRPINLLQDHTDSASSIYSPSSGSELSIFDTKKLFKENPIEGMILKGTSEFVSGESFDSFSEKYNADIAAKMRMSVNSNLFVPISLSASVSTSTGYEVKSAKETKTLFARYRQVIKGKTIELPGYANSKKYSVMLSDAFKEGARNVAEGKMTEEEFVAIYGTHTIMAAEYGAAVEANYFQVNTSTEVSADWYAKASAAIGMRIAGSGGDMEMDADTRQAFAKDSANTKTAFSVTVLGGSPSLMSAISLEGFAAAQKEWAKTVDEESYALTDVPQGSLYCNWDFLDESYAEAKNKLDAYVLRVSQERYKQSKAKFATFYAEEPEPEEGSAAKPIQIGTAEEFLTYTDRCLETVDKHYALTDDIDFDGIKVTPRRAFYGKLDGKGHSLKNIILDLDETGAENIDFARGYHLGLFQRIYGDVENLKLENMTVKYTHGALKDMLRVGLLAGDLQGGTISTVTVGGKITIVNDSYLGSWVGGLLGEVNSGNVIRCSTDVEISVTNSNAGGNDTENDHSMRVGGVVGSMQNGRVDSCRANGIIRATMYNDRDIYIGGFFGVLENRLGPGNSIPEEKPIVGNCYSMEEVHAVYENENVKNEDAKAIYAGGFAGLCRGVDIGYCYAVSTVNISNKRGKAYAGGFVGSACKSAIRNSFAAGTVYSHGNSLGAEKNYSYFGRFIATEEGYEFTEGNTFEKLYVNMQSGLKNGYDTADDDHYIEKKWKKDKKYIDFTKTEDQLVLEKFQVDELGFDKEIWKINGGVYPTLIGLL